MKGIDIDIRIANKTDIYGVVSAEKTSFCPFVKFVTII